MKRKTNVKDRILKAALTLFSKRSYTKVSVDNIASKAGVSKGAIFHYFKSKLEIAEKALEYFLNTLIAAP